VGRALGALDAYQAVHDSGGIVFRL